MRPLTLAALSLFAATAVAAPTHAHGLQFHASCSVSTDYGVNVRPDGLLFTRDDGTPRQVLMHDGQLQVDGRTVAVNSADAQRLRQYESQVRALVPEVAAIAREGVGIGFDALTTVAATFADTPAERESITHELATQRTRVMTEVEQGIAHGHWQHKHMDQLMQDDMADAVATLAGTVAARAVKAALSGDQSQVAALQARADSLETSIDRAVDARAAGLEQRADALCPRLAALDQLQHQFTFRLRDGSPLQLMRLERNHDASVADTQTP